MDNALRVLKKQTFPLMGTPRTLWELYIGFGLLFSVFMLLASILTWQLSRAVQQGEWRHGWRGVAWSLFAAQLAVTALCWTHFFIAPQLISTLATVFLGLGARRLASSEEQPPLSK